MRLRAEASEGAAKFLYFVGVILAVTGLVNLYTDLEFFLRFSVSSPYCIAAGLFFLVAAYFINQENAWFLGLASLVWLYQTYWFFNLLYGYFSQGSGSTLLEMSRSAALIQMSLILIGSIFHLVPYALFIRSLPTRRKRV